MQEIEWRGFKGYEFDFEGLKVKSAFLRRRKIKFTRANGNFANRCY